MKSLSLLRHAEAEQPFGVADKERNLSNYGAQMAPRLGRRLEQQGFMPDQVICSPATRTLETARIICYELGFPVNKLQIREEIYRASINNLMQVIHEADETKDHLLLVGHNPGLSELATYLCNSSAVPSHMATCALLRIQLPIDYWAMADRGTGQFLDYDTPENVA